MVTSAHCAVHRVSQRRRRRMVRSQATPPRSHPPLAAALAPPACAALRGARPGGRGTARPGPGGPCASAGLRSAQRGGLYLRCASTFAGRPGRRGLLFALAGDQGILRSRDALCARGLPRTQPHRVAHRERPGEGQVQRTPATTPYFSHPHRGGGRVPSRTFARCTPSSSRSSTNEQETPQERSIQSGHT